MTSRPDLENGLRLLRLERLCRVKVVRPPGLRLKPAPPPSPASRGPDITAATGHWCWPLSRPLSLSCVLPRLLHRGHHSTHRHRVSLEHVYTVCHCAGVITGAGAGAGARCGPHCVRTRTRPLLPPAQETLASAAPRRWRLLLSAANSGNCPRPLYITYLLLILDAVSNV